MVCRKDEAFKRVGNDRKAFRRLFKYEILTNYLHMFILVFFLSMWFLLSMFFSAKNTNISPETIAVIAGILLVWPFISFLILFVLGIIPYLLGKLFGGRARRYKDFFKVMNYTRPIGKFVSLVPFAGLVYSVYTYIFLYKTYTNVHKLSSESAGWCMGILIVLGLVVGAFVYIVSYVLGLFLRGAFV